MDTICKAFEENLGDDCEKYHAVSKIVSVGGNEGSSSCSYGGFINILCITSVVCVGIAGISVFICRGSIAGVGSILTIACGAICLVASLAMIWVSVIADEVKECQDSSKSSILGSFECTSSRYSLGGVISLSSVAVSFLAAMVLKGKKWEKIKLL